MTLNLPTYIPIATKFVDTGNLYANIDFQNIPQKYTDLLISFTSAANSQGPAMNNYMYFNNDSGGSSYSGTMVTPTGTSYYSNFSLIPIFPGVSPVQGVFYPSTTFFYIPNYRNSYNKVCLNESIGGNLLSQNSSVVAPFQGGVHTWRNTSAINRISFSGGIFGFGTEITIFGLG